MRDIISDLGLRIGDEKEITAENAEPAEKNTVLLKD